MTINTYSPEWRRICEARWVLYDCKDSVRYMEGVLAKRGAKAHAELQADVLLVRQHAHNFTKRVAKQLIEQMEAEKNGTTA